MKFTVIDMQICSVVLALEGTQHPDLEEEVTRTIKGCSVHRANNTLEHAAVKAQCWPGLRYTVNPLPTNDAYMSQEFQLHRILSILE